MSSAWDFVWCHQHCHEQGMAQASKKYREICRDVGATMIPLMNAAFYQTWQKEPHQSRPHILITCWLEVKPILRGLMDEGPNCDPLEILVLAENKDEFRRASRWAWHLKDARVTVRGSAFETLKARLVSYGEKIHWATDHHTEPDAVNVSSGLQYSIVE
eukprot:TRINITY_DN7436_c0_g2_i7.p1 TRINITY_DN7436_c0_g2~~TRINITY_DN7436_c0_g2_i7.p1  ORF type:complete len:159 (-),score=17.23 TRINITY_DN7436_c0_g2_i7:131-607(-)